jgi:hypothetical protein
MIQTVVVIEDCRDIREAPQMLIGGTPGYRLHRSVSNHGRSHWRVTVTVNTGVVPHAARYEKLHVHSKPEAIAKALPGGLVQ